MTVADTRLPEGAGARTDLSYALHGALARSDNLLLLLEQRGGTAVILAANDQVRATTGFDEPALLGRPLTLLASPEADPATLDAVLAAARDGKPQHTQIKCRTRDGRDIWLELHLMPAGDGEGGRRSVLLGHDATARLRAQQQEAAVQSLLAKVFVTVDAPVYILDLQGRFLMTNPAFDKVVGVPSGSLAGKTVLDYYTTETARDIAACRRQQDLDGLDYNLAVVLRTASGDRPGRMTGVMVQRPDLSRFRIVTVNMQPPTGPLVSLATSVAGKLHLIGLDEVRDALGAKWPLLAERAMVSAEHLLRRRLGPMETFSRAQDCGFLVCFAGLTEEEAAFRAQTIGRELRTKLIGGGQTPEIAHVVSAVAAMPPGAPPADAAELGAVMHARLAEKLAATQQVARSRIRDWLQSLTYEAEIVHARKMSGVMGHYVRLPHAAERALHAAFGVLPSAETAALDLDAMMIAFAQAFAVQDALAGGSHMVFVMLGADTPLLGSRLDACAEACRSLDEHTRQRLVLLIHAQPGLAASQIAQALARLRPLCRFAGLAAEWLDGMPADCMAQHVKIVALDARRFLSQPQWQPRLRTLAGSLRLQNCRLMIHGVPSASEMDGLFDLGVELVSLPPR